MSFISSIRHKPWMIQKDRPELREASGIIALSSERVGLYVFLVVASSLFGLFTVSYLLRMDYQDWRPLTEPWQLWMNTVFLLMASIALQLAVRASHSLDILAMEQRLKAAGVLTLAFIVGQLWVWFVISSEGYSVAVNPSSSFYFLITGVHGVHILGGLVAWCCVVQRIKQGASQEYMQLTIKLCATYWHYLFIVWLFVFYLLLVT